MTTKIKFLAVLLTVISTAAYAAGPEKVLEKKDGDGEIRILPGSENGIFKVHYVEAQSQWVEVNIYNASGKKLVSDQIKSNEGFSKPYNFQGLNPGVYEFEIIDQNGKYQQKVIYKNLPESPVAVQRKGEDKFKLIVGAEMGNEITVRILLDDDRLLLEEKIDSKTGFSKVYDLSKAKSKSRKFTFEIKSEKSFKRFTM